ncbi:MAG: efflux RND transporter periplasmic adaptor subunit [Longimicrobiales bacterium]
MTTHTQNAKPRRSMRRRILPVLILGGGLLAAFSLVASRPVPERIATPRLAPMVTTETLAPRDAPLLVEGTGTVRPTSEITLSAEVGGRVVMVSPKLVRGGAFAIGDTLLKIDDRSYRNAVSIARAEVEQRRVDVALAAQNQAIAQREYELLRQRLGSAAPADTSLAAQLARQQPQYEAAQASLYRAEAQLADAELSLTRSVVVAPFAGRVRSETVDIGQFISPGQAVAEIYGTDAVEVDISLSTRQAALIDDLWSENEQVRIPATVRAEFGGAWHEWEGFVEHASGALDETTRTVEVVIRIPSPFAAADARPPLLIGSYVRADIIGRAVGAHYAVPRSALREGSTVWAVTEEGTLVSRPVRVIQEIQDTVFVRADMAAAPRIVISDLSVMTEGMEVRIDGLDDPSARTVRTDGTEDRDGHMAGDGGGQ